eukprot:5095867-Prorocentrum_lima.AAC.1
MTSSLVGSEMCIRDRLQADGRLAYRISIPEAEYVAGDQAVGVEGVPQPVSYTHLTLPTICSV